MLIVDIQFSTVIIAESSMLPLRLGGIKDSIYKMQINATHKIVRDEKVWKSLYI